MKITKRQLRRIIREAEEASTAVGELEDVEAIEDAWAGGEDLVQAIDYTKELTGESNVDEPEVMDIIVKEVRRRIRRTTSTKRLRTR